MRRRNPQNIFFFLLVVYMILLLKLVVFKGSFSDLAEHFTPDDQPSPYRRQLNNFVPFKMLYYYITLKEPLDSALRNVLGNILLFIPFGFLHPFARPKWNRFGKTVLAVFLTSLFFEVLQLLTYLGSFDVDDILLNIVGGIIGWTMYKFIMALVFPSSRISS